MFSGLWFRWVRQLLDPSHLESLRLLQRITQAVFLAYCPIHWSLRDRILFGELPKGILIGCVEKTLIFPEHPGPLCIPTELIGTCGSVCMWCLPGGVWAPWTSRLPRSLVETLLELWGGVGPSSLLWDVDKVWSQQSPHNLPVFNLHLPIWFAAGVFQEMNKLNLLVPHLTLK